MLVVSSNNLTQAYFSVHWGILVVLNSFKWGTRCAGINRVPVLFPTNFNQEEWVKRTAMLKKKRK